VRLELSGGVAEIVLDRAPVNPLTTALLTEMNEALDQVPEDAGTLLVTSALGRIFMAGADIDFMRGAPLTEQGSYVRTIQRTFSRLEAWPAPVVVGIDGHCLGGGLELALACDLRVVAETATLGLPEATLGILAAAGGIQRLVRAVPQAVAHDMLLCGRRISGAEAGAWGLASRLTAPGEATAAARELAAELAAGSTPALAATKRLALAAAESVPSRLDREWSAWMEVRAGDDAREGLTAFVEKREPRFA
jgi:enoyl-CoA hydratase/carnithine racemase